MTNSIKKMPGGIKFLLGMVAIYFVASIFNASLVLNSLEKAFQTFVKLLPVLVLVFGVIFVVNLLLNPEKIKRHLGHDSGIKGWFFASAASVLIVSPPYVVFPLLGQLKEHGMRYSLMAVFLGNRNVQPAFLPVMAFYFGLPFTVVISVYILIFSVLSGIIMGKVMKESESIPMSDVAGIV